MGTFNILPSSQVGPQTPTDGQIVYPRCGNYGQIMADSIFGKYAELTRRGLVYCAHGAAIVIPIFSATAQKFVLWNKSAGGTKVVPLVVTFGQVGTPTVPSDLGCALIQGAGTTLGTPISAFTETNPFNTKTFLAGAGVARFSVAATVVAPTICCSFGISQIGVLAAASATTPWSSLAFDFNGLFEIQPGNAMCITECFAGTLPTMDVSLYYAEVPNPG
jgi:hypothetical protein